MLRNSIQLKIESMTKKQHQEEKEVITNKPKKLLLQFKNFANNIDDNIFTDYALIDKQRILFNSKEYAAHLNYRCICRSQNRSCTDL